MTTQLFSFWGYASVLLWLAVLVLWALHAVLRPRRWLCHIAVLVAIVALAFAKLNSVTYVNRIQIDRSEELEAARARQEAARKAAEQARADEVAQVRFAEDDADDFLDEAGMEEADLKYMASFEEGAVPEWKQEKKTRSQTPTEDDSLEAMIDTTAEEPTGVDAVAAEEAAREPIMMPEAGMMLANRLDAWNLKLIRWLILVGLGIVVWDYLKRINSYQEAYFPLPLPSAWSRGLTPMPPVQRWPEPRRRAMPEELAWLVRKGETFLYLTDDKQAAAAVSERLPRLPPGHQPVDVIHVTDEAPIDADFVFETLWYGRSSFVIESPALADGVTRRTLELLEERKASRAHVRQTVHVVWDLSMPSDARTVAAFERLGRATGVVLVMRG